MANPKYIIVLVTTGTLDEAQTISSLLLERKKAACVNILPGMFSSYWWEGKIESAEETLLVVKTLGTMLPDVISLIKSVHSYSVPEIVALTIAGGNPDYLAWLDKSLA